MNRETIDSLAEYWEIADSGRFTPLWNIGHWSRKKLLFLWLSCGLLLGVAYNTLATTPPYDPAFESFSILIVVGMLVIWVFALLGPVGLLVITLKWLRQRRSYGRSH